MTELSTLFNDYQAQAKARLQECAELRALLTTAVRMITEAQAYGHNYTPNDRARLQAMKNTIKGDTSRATQQAD